MLTALLLTFAIDPPEGKEPPLKLELFAKEDWYKSQAGKEQSFTGVLRKVERGKGVAGFGRFNPYTLDIDTEGERHTRAVYVGGKLDILAPYVGKRVTLTGKAVDMEVEGRNHREIWPARLEVVAQERTRERGGPLAAQDAKGGEELKILAKAMWRYAPANPDGKREGVKLVLKTAADLVAATPFSQLDAPQQVVEKMATAELAKTLKVDSIDWTKQMLIVVTAGVKRTGGYSVEITSLKVADKALTVAWKINPPKGFATQAFTHPGQVVLVPRFEGEVKFAAPTVEGKGASGRLPPERFESPAREAPAQDEKPAGRELKATARSNARIGAGSTVIRSAKELAAAEGGKGDPAVAGARLAKLLKVDSIDWDKQMIIVISGGVQRSGGYSVELKKLAAADKTLTVHWTLNRPKPGQPVTLALTHPMLTVLVERFDGEVRFDPPPPKGKGGRSEK
jgi:hypothetical protein